jgi:heme-degrading monooxygenase HmoA
MVVFVNQLTLTGDAEELLRIYRSVASYFARQPGLIRYQLVQALDDPRVFFNIAEWTDTESFRRATRQEQFQTAVRVSEVSTGAPHLCTVVLEGLPAAVEPT